MLFLYNKSSIEVKLNITLLIYRTPPLKKNILKLRVKTYHILLFEKLLLSNGFHFKRKIQTLVIKIVKCFSNS